LAVGEIKPKANRQKPKAKKMRLIAEIPHDRYKISLFNYNAKYMVKIELGQFEQMFKIGETDVMSIEEVKNMITPELLSNCLQRFISMRSDWEKAFQNKNTNNLA
jgi:hypothetical protein|tara:strand:- start:5895 stop:6209 length:315 start_codon:yes stop_codon:yes gene_type:complete